MIMNVPTRHNQVVAEQNVAARLLGEVESDVVGGFEQPER